MGLWEKLFPPSVETLMERNDREGFLQAMKRESFWADEKAALANARKMGIEDEVTIQSVMDVLGRCGAQNIKLRCSLVSVLAGFEEKAASAVPALVRVMVVAQQMSAGDDLSDHLPLMGQAGATISLMNEPGLEELLKCLDSPTKSLRVMALKVLKISIADSRDRVVPILIGMLSTDDRDILINAVDVLMRIRHEAFSVEQMRSAFDKETDPTIRAAIERLRT